MKKVIALGLAVLAPVLAFAQTTQVKDISSGFHFAGVLFNNITIFIFGLSVVWFFWGVFSYVVKSSGDEEGHKKARDIILQGIIGLAVMASVYGLVSFVTGSFGFSNVTPQLPNIPTPSNN